MRPRGNAEGSSFPLPSPSSTPARSLRDMRPCYLSPVGILAGSRPKNYSSARRGRNVFWKEGGAPMAFTDTHPDSLFHLLRELKDDLADLIRKEIALAKREAAAKAKEIGKSAALFGAAIAIALFSVFYFCLFLDHLLLAGLAALGLSMPMSAWLAPLFLGALLGMGAFLIVLSGLRSLRHADPNPASWRTVRSLRALRTDSRRARAAGKG